MKYKQIIAIVYAAVLYFFVAASSLPQSAYHFDLHEETEAFSDSETGPDGSASFTKLAADASEDCLISAFSYCAELSAQASEALTEDKSEELDPEELSAADIKQIAVQPICQLPELPTGCEVVSLTMVLNHLGYDADKLTLAREYLPKMKFYRSKGMLYGADFRTTFAGDPESKRSYGCYAPCIAETARRYLADTDPDRTVYDITGTSIDTLMSEYINNNIPVIIWITSDDLHAPKLTDSWQTPEGEKVQWVAYEHCVVLTGYDKSHGLIYVADPLVGNTSYSYLKLCQRYADLGMQAIYIQ